VSQNETVQKDKIEKLIRDIRKGQSMLMLIDTYKLSRFRINCIARKNKLTVYDPELPSDREFHGGRIKGSGPGMSTVNQIVSQW
jgi:hypothetical protein